MDLWESNLARFDQYVMNEIPIHLIRLSDMKIVRRNDVKKHSRSSVSELDYDVFFHPAKYAKYAILSHRWLDEGEPTYEEMEAGTAAGPGYEKLKKFCEKARKDGMEFAWSDTCCIDKSSSTELDESIRSMFRWYQNSSVCIVHLAQSEDIEDIQKDEWIRRGWTLQELLAQHIIKFFNARWMPMTGDENDKTPSMKPDGSPDILRALEEATDIPRDVLTSDLGKRPMRVDERMAWAATRKTTRVEDAAYSLMGIFNVSLQIAYGEGRDRAFCRLIEAIMQTGDPSVLNWHDPSPARHHSGSCTFPQSPFSFRMCDHRQFDFDRPLEMTMTSLGLRIPLVIFPLIVHSISKDALFTELRLRCWFCLTLEIQTTCRTSDIKFTNCQYALGIVNYSVIGDGTREVLSIRDRSAGVLLSRHAEHSLPGYQPPPYSNDFVGLKFAFPLEYKLTEWKLLAHIDSTLVVVDFPNVPSGSHFYINRGYLQTVHI
ncbi:heterokaryon incompatibility protein-domain-containing protein [Suillus lakei]|nr:heterokaryon incompatibility protein-domain-containing protein [Suillus lakei]